MYHDLSEVSPAGSHAAGSFKYQDSYDLQSMTPEQVEDFLFCLHGPAGASSSLQFHVDSSIEHDVHEMCERWGVHVLHVTRSAHPKASTFTILTFVHQRHIGR